MRPLPRGWIARGQGVVAAALLAACSGAPGEANDGEPARSTSQAIYGGQPDNDARQNQGVVSLRIGDGAQFELCSASLIAPNVVLTARHCVSVNTTTTVACDENGASGNGDQLGADMVASTIHVYLGAAPNFTGVPAASGKAIFHSQTNVICNADMALVVLDKNVTGVTPLKVRLTGATATGEMVRAVGYGQNDQQLPIGTRLRKDNVGILAVGKKVSTNMTALATNEFEVGLSICQGDSGGPAISETSGAVVGVVSRGGNCTDTFGHIYTSLTGSASVFQQAFALAGGAPTDENGTVPPPPAPDAGVGTGGGTDGGTGGNETPTDPTPNHPQTNLRAGAGNNCSATGAPSPGTTELGGIALGMLAALGLFVARRRRDDDV